jgi:hypothetical protein
MSLSAAQEDTPSPIPPNAPLAAAIDALPTRRPAFKPATAAMPRRQSRRAGRCTSSTSIVGAVPGRTSRRWTSTGRAYLAGVKRATGLPRPIGSSRATIAPASSAEWGSIYDGAARLVQSGAVNSVIDASYGGLFVDEYQDCTRRQHAVVRLLADHIPCCIFGDPLEGIFDFRDQQPVDWNRDVLPAFPSQGELRTPRRWKNAGNGELADWLKVEAISQIAGIGLNILGAIWIGQHWATIVTYLEVSESANHIRDTAPTMLMRSCHSPSARPG